ncbi:MAG: UDP-glucose 4-epimerase GalE [Eubacteriales bacterium]|jgi:UDP-glucose 4-epimerase|nr:UDP-glucose 4-epimerase GalE [Eubacteriales bacterium]
MRILVTGGAGYIGSHTCLSLLRAGHDVVVVDDLRNASQESLRRVEKLAGKALRFHEMNVCDPARLEQVFAEGPLDCVIHFAGLKAVGESVEKPLEYYQNNLSSTLTLCRVMLGRGVSRLIFSSSATVYAPGAPMPVEEGAALGCTNPYGWTKFMGEQILRDVTQANPGFSCVLLRYFNPIGADPSGEIGEDPAGIPNNLMPFITQTVSGKLRQLEVFGADYDTPDGTGVRDYIHVSDLAAGHLAAMEYAMKNTGAVAVNLGTGQGYSVLEIIRAFEKANHLKVPFAIGPRRPGDVGTVYANPRKARELLGWEALKGIEDMCRDAWRWQKQNPAGYGG